MPATPDRPLSPDVRTPADPGTRSSPRQEGIVPGVDTVLVLHAPDARTLLIRRAVPDDAPAVLAHLLRVGAETSWLSFGAAGPGVTEAAERAFLARAASGDTALAVVVERDGAIVARLTFDAYPRPRTGHGGELGIAVERACWGTGVGRRLMELLVAWAERGGRVRKLNLRVHVDNARAIALYTSLGFVIEGRITRDTLEQDGTFHDAFLMGRPIDPLTTP